MVKKNKIIFVNLIILLSTTIIVSAWDYCSFTSGWHCVNGDWCRDLQCCWYNGVCEKDWHCPYSVECGGDDDNVGSTTPNPVCGNGDVESGEECDDGNKVTESCNYGQTNCQVCDENCNLVAGATSYCGDDTTDSNYEECDDANTVTEICNYGQTSCQICDENCQLIYGVTSYCGDGNIDYSYGEECDDQNTNDDDCCSNLCNNVPAPPALKSAEGVCRNSVKECVDGNWAEPNYFKIPDYQETETLCDRKDNDCDGEWDEGLGSPYYYDSDGDKYGDKYLQPELLCPTDITPLYVSNNLDCNDSNDLINPSAKEICGDNIDDDCSGTPDDNCPCVEGDIFCNNRPGVCSSYEQICGLDGKIPVCDWNSLSNYEGNENICDNLDNDCDNQIDEGCDDDKDGYADSSMKCDNNFVDGNSNIKSCSDYENDCDDNNANVYPDNTEVCDGLDNNCDNSIDNVPEEETPYCHEVMSGYNNVGVCYNQKATCNYQRYKDWYCSLSDFYSNEICSDDLDNDCDGLVDEGCACESGEERICGSDLGECRQGVQKCVDSKWGECEDSVSPVEETCDNLDNDCDGTVDENVKKDCTSNEGCPGIQTCHEGQWLDCEAKCENYIQIELNNDDFGKFVIDAKLNRQDVKDSLETLKVVNQTLSFSSKGDKITLKNTINPTNELKDFDYNLYIPKCLTPYLDQIEFENKEYTIIKEDPLIAWHFVNVNDRIDLNYEVKGQIDEACLEQIKGLPIAKVIGSELSKSKSVQVRNNLIKFIIFIWLVFFTVSSVVYINKRHPEKSKKSEDDYKTDFIEKEKKLLLKKIKEMKFKSKEQARHHMENLGISNEIKEWILKKL